jgi:oligopeptide transport system substrate-binding protein
MSRCRFLTAIIVGLLSAWSVQAAAVLRVGLPAWPATLDPHRAVTRTDHVLARELFVGLTMLDSNGKIVPGLAESWVVSPDGLTYTFSLREGLNWSNGQALDATSVVKSIERALDPATAAPFAAQLLTIKNAEAFRLGTLSAGEKLGLAARDRRTVEFRLSNPSQRFLQVLAQPVAAPVPTRRSGDLKPGWAAPDSIIGNGPYMIAPRPQGYGLSKNPAFFAASSVSLEDVELTVLSTLPAASQAVRDGVIDLALAFTPEPRTGRAALRASITTEAVASYQLAINLSRPPLDKREARHALGMVIDRTEIIKSLRLVDAEPAFNMVPAPPYAPLRAPYARLDRSASAIVAEALLLDVDIPALGPIRFIHPAGAVHQAIAEAVAKPWRAMGFKVELTALADADHEAAVLAGSFDVAVSVDWRQANTIDAMVFAFGQTAGPWNAVAYREPEFEQFMLSADTETAPEFYDSHLRQAEGVLIEDQVTWPIVFYPANLPARAAYKGLTLNPAQLHPLRSLSPP